MESLHAFASPNAIRILEENAEANNLPRIGVPDNIAYPAVQLNIAPAVSFEECGGKHPYFFLAVPFQIRTYRQRTAGNGRLWTS